jgi:hypothetical protein
MIKRMLVVAGVLGTLCGSLPADAHVALGAGVSGNFGLRNDAVALPNSWSVHGLVGYQLNFDILQLTPEVELTYLRSGEVLARREVEWSFQAAAGGRLGVALGPVVPSIYAHFGLGTVSLSRQDLVTHIKSGPYWEVGGALDFQLSEYFSFGLQAGYGGVSLSAIETDLANSKVDWVRAGAHFTFFL